MKRLLTLVVAILFPALAGSVQAVESSPATSARESLLFNNGWKFELTDSPGYRSPGYDDSAWRTLDLPHDWSIESPYDPKAPSGGAGGFFPEGIGWYRKRFTVGAEQRNRRTTIQFDGVYMNSEVWINGHFLGRYPYGYSTFQYDLTDYLRIGPGRQNVLAVRVDNSLPKSTRWYNGSGIYRNVRLITTNTTHFHNGHGVFVTTPEVTSDAATVSAQYHLVAGLFSDEEVESYKKNRSSTKPAPHKCVLRSIVLDESGAEVARAEENVTLQSFDKNIHLSQRLEVPKPSLWSASSPAMYSLKSGLLFEGVVVDEIVTPFGIRDLQFDANRGMLVNGEPIKLKGVCLHHEAGSLGAAVPLRMWRYRLQKLKAAGCNAIRTAHNPFAPEFYDLCDTMGFYVMDEAFDEWTRGWPRNFNEQNRGKADNGYHLYFDQWSDTDLRAMIRRDRNHPSVVMYSIGNEVPDQLDVDGHQRAERLVAICHEEDATRPVTAGCDQYMTAERNGFMDALDIMGYNYAARHRPEAMYGPPREQRPGKLFIGTETKDTQRDFLAYRDNDYVIGQFIWVGQDYLGEAEAAPLRGWQTGLIDIAGGERPSYYRHQCYWSDTPVARLAVASGEASPRMSWNGAEGDEVTVTVYSNCEEAELFVNDNSRGRRKVDPDSYSCEWRVAYTPGAVSAIAYSDGQEQAIDSLQTAGEPHHFVVKPCFGGLGVAQDIEILEITIVDEAGRHAPDATNVVELTLNGPARVIGVDSCDMTFTGDFKAPVRRAHCGRLLAIVQGESQDGAVSMRVSSKGLAPAEVDLRP